MDCTQQKLNLVKQLVDKQMSTEDKLNLLTKALTKTPQLVNDNTNCPLLIILVGLWSSNYKKTRNYAYSIEHYCSRATCFKACLQQFLQHDINPNIRHMYSHGSTTLHWLVAWDRPYEAVEFLSMCPKTDVNTTDSGGRSPLALLVARKYFGRTKQAQTEDELLVEKLVTHNAQVDLADDWGNTALHYACLKRDRQSIESMKQKHNLDALWTQPNKDGYTPVDLCKATYKIVKQYILHAYNSSKPEAMICAKRWNACASEFFEYVVTLTQSV